MKALWIIYDIVLDDQLIAMLRNQGIEAFTRWPRLTGVGPVSGARYDDAIWPGANSVILTIQPDDTVAKMLTRLQKLRNEVGSMTGLWAYTTGVQDVLAPPESNE